MSAHPARQAAATTAATTVAGATVEDHRKVRTDWFADARKALNNLPVALSESVKDRDERIEQDYLCLDRW